MADRLALEFGRQPSQAPKVTATDVNGLIEALFRTHTWVTAEQLGFHTENQKPALRAIAAKSRGHVISGQAGYRLHFEATADESLTALAGWRNMRDEITRKIIEAERVYHRKEVPEILRARVEAARPAA